VQNIKEIATAMLKRIVILFDARMEHLRPTGRECNRGDYATVHIIECLKNFTSVLKKNEICQSNRQEEIKNSKVYFKDDDRVKSSM
jgi:hypothetical protein